MTIGFPTSTSIQLSLPNDINACTYICTTHVLLNQTVLKKLMEVAIGFPTSTSTQLPLPNDINACTIMHLYMSHVLLNLKEVDGSGSGSGSGRYKGN